MPYIFEAHIGYKSMFSYKKKGNIKLVNGLNGQPILTHYINKNY